jgi:Holliday junction resolvase
MIRVNRPKEKGDRAERAVVDFLDHNGFTVRRIPAGHHDDVGDLEVHHEVVFEVKDRKKLELSAWIAKLNVQKAHKDSAYAFLGIKLHGKTNAEDWAYLVDGATLVNILRLIQKQ